MLIFLKGEVMRAKKGGSLRIFYVKAKEGGGRCKNTFRYECVCMWRGGVAQVYLAWFLLDVWRV